MKREKRQQNLRKRAEILRLIRRFFFENNYLEIETPIRIPAPIPEAYIDSFDSEGWCLHSSPEICMKQLLASGYEKIYQLSRVFRKGERGNKHLPEFTMLEWYTKGDSYIELMQQLEDLVRLIAIEFGEQNKIQYNKNIVDFGSAFEKLSVKNAFEKYSEISMEQALSDKKFDEIMGFEIEPLLGLTRPVFLYDYPAEKASLARLKKDDNKYAERFELYISGLELCNGFSELADPVEQRMRFIMEQEIRVGENKNIYPLPEKFLTALMFFPESAGVAVGIDRLVMLFTDSDDINDVVAFSPEELVDD